MALAILALIIMVCFSFVMDALSKGIEVEEDVR